MRAAELGEMKMNETTLQVPKDVLEPIIQAHISAAVVAALGDRSKIIADCIGKVLNTKTESDGSETRYGTGIPWVQWIMQDCIKKSARAAIEEFMASHKDEIKAQIAAELRKKNSPLAKQLIEGMLNGITNETTLKYRLNVTVEGS